MFPLSASVKVSLEPDKIAQDRIKEAFQLADREIRKDPQITKISAEEKSLFFYNEQTPGKLTFRTYDPAYIIDFGKITYESTGDYSFLKCDLVMRKKFWYFLIFFLITSVVFYIL